MHIRLYNTFKQCIYRRRATQLAIKKWGNSQGIILSKEIMEMLNAHIGDALEATFENGNLILKSPEKQIKHRTLEERMEESGLPLAFGEEIDWGESRGNELW